MRFLSILAAAALLPAPPALARPLAVVTDFAPVQSLAAKVMGDLGAPAVLVAAGADPHDYQLRPSQARLLSGADLAIWVGPELTPWLARILDNASAAPRLALLADPATPRRLFEAGGGTDPHAWLDPEIAAIWIGLIRDALIAADAPNAATYRANADAALADLAALEAELRATLAPVKAPIAVGHDALGYFAARFGLKVAAAVEAGDAAEPGLRHLQEVHALLARGEAVCLFPEAGYDPRREEQLVEGTPARLGQPIDPEGLALAPGPDLYDDLLRQLAKTIAACARG
ncbi:MAG: zinc ABC transporter substrate-binding protein [Proteobacteria bacterium]|nr:zinc ABC transporter substrate-binding protein [Pseudomonadota bacterium]MBS0574628.1 zinc ABC transporter substrate-binding protein [Pseudomonadota bacterium]